MMIHEIIGKILAGERDGTTLWKIAIGEIEYDPITDPAEGVSVAALAENILRCGQLQPVLLYRIKDKRGTRSQYCLISGRRRLEAMRMLGHTHINAIVVRCDEERANVLSLSENLLHREPDYLELAMQAFKLLEGGMELGKLAALLSMQETELQRLLDLKNLPEEELRLIRFVGVSGRDVMRLPALPSAARRAILEKCATNPEARMSDLIDEWVRNPDARIAQSQKIWVSDIRMFLNTVERAAETMQSAGFHTRVKREDGTNSYTFTVQVSKRAGVLLKDESSENVSRETFSATKRRTRFSSALSIFEALAEDECSFAQDVSRETSYDGLAVSAENAEKLELCIDGALKK